MPDDVSPSNEPTESIDSINAAPRASDESAAGTVAAPTEPTTRAHARTKTNKLARAWRQWRARVHGHSRMRRRLTRAGLSIVGVIVVFAGSAYGYTLYRNDQISHVKVGHLVSGAGPENILLIGSTSRCALDNKQTGAFGACSQGVTGVNSDVVMILRLDSAHRRVSLLSIPRDTFLPNARPAESNRIDSALAYGPTQLVSVVEQDFGIPINHYVELNFDGFQNIVKALGGMYMYFPNQLKDADSSLSVLHRGCVKIGAFQALAIVRARHLSYMAGGKWIYDPTGDLGRIIRVHEFLRVLASAVAHRGVGNVLTDNAVIGALAPQLTVDNGFSITNMVNLILTYHRVDPAAVPEQTIPVEVDPSFSYQYKGYNYGAIVFPSEPGTDQVLASFEGKPLAAWKLAPSKISVAVVGGTASPSATAAAASKLHALGYEISATSEATPVGPVSETQVLYARGHLDEGERVLASLSGAVALGQAPAGTVSPVTVVTGSDFTVNSTNAIAKAAVTASFYPATNGPVLTASSNVLSAPTPSSTPLPSYDPRACPNKY